MKIKKAPHEHCPLANVMKILGGKWVLIVLGILSQGTKRFKELEYEIGIISPKMLTSTLDRLEKEGLVLRTVTTTKPLRVDYSLTMRGELIKPVLWELMKFGEALEQANRIPEA